MTVTGAELSQAAEEGLDEALQEAAELVVERAKQFMPEHDPVRDPDPAVNLADRIFIERDPSGRSLVVIVRAPQAAKQHEALHFEHPRGGGPKFLERALTEIVPEFPDIIASKVRGRIRARTTGR